MWSYATPSERVIAFSYHLCNCLHCRWGDDRWDRDTMSKLVIVAHLHLFFFFSRSALFVRAFLYDDSVCRCDALTGRHAYLLQTTFWCWWFWQHTPVPYTVWHICAPLKRLPCKTQRKKQTNNNQCSVIRWKTLNNRIKDGYRGCKIFIIFSHNPLH